MPVAGPANRRRSTGEPAPPSPPPAREENPGLINEIGKLFEKSKSLLPPLKSPSETIDDLNARAKDAGDTSLSRLAKPSSMVTRARDVSGVRATARRTARPAPTSSARAKGYKEGKSLDTDAAEKCSPKVYLPGYKRQPGDCRTENYVTSALCQ